MALTTGLLFTRLVTLIYLFAQLVYGHNVPVLMWASKSEPTFSALSSLSHVTSDQFSKAYLKEILHSARYPIIAFIQDRFSIEDMTMHGNGLQPEGPNYKNLEKHLEENPSLVLPSVENPFQVLRKMEGHNSVNTLNYNDDVRHKLSGAVPGLNIIYLPPTVGLDNRPEALKANDELMSKAVAPFPHYIAMLTGKEPSWDASSEEATHRRIARSLLAAPSDNETTIAIHVGLATVRIVDPAGVNNVSSQNLTWPPTTKLETENDTLMMTWTFSPPPQEFKSFQVKLGFGKGPSYWIAKNMTSTFETASLGKWNVNLTADRTITAGKGFSFSCGKTVLKSKEKYLNSTSLRITLRNFQVYPFSTMNSTNSTFPESFHCSTFFTMPVWMGFFTVLLFTAILGLGVFMLFQVKTMDRFDDPKGKTITVPQSE